ncbi:MAG: hypothetical protein JNJ64_12180 [Flavobacteriales bacterium]|nr:hypothetical protein [Flavobacteriales bacterium]
MTRRPHTLLLVAAAAGALNAAAQKRQPLPEPSFTLKGTLVLPVPVGLPLFNDLTESVGGFDLCAQYPFWKGLGVGLGGRATWFGLEERSFAPQNISGEIVRATWFGKLQWEKYTGGRTFVEFAAKAGLSDYHYTSSGVGERRTVKASGLHWGGQFTFYLHATDNLAFGVQVGYEQDEQTLSPDKFGLESFPGRTVQAEGPPYGFLTVGLGFSTRFRKSADRGEW